MKKIYNKIISWFNKTNEQTRLRIISNEAANRVSGGQLIW